MNVQKRALACRAIAAGVGMILGIALLSGCSFFGDKETPAQEAEQASVDAQAVVITADNVETICGMQWILKEMTLDGEAFALTGEVPFVHFETDGNLGGFASINRFFGNFSLDAQGNLSLSPMGASMMAGPENLMAQEAAFLKGFKSADKLVKAGMLLKASSADGQTLLVFYVPVN